MLILTHSGLFCPAGNFYIDPKHAVAHAVITHAHSDHARRGSQHYYCTKSGAALLKARLGKNIQLSSHSYRETFKLGEVTLSYHPAGHILGSSQIRLEHRGEVWVVSGDYKRDPDPSCEAFETVPCDVFITEATFGTPTYHWNKTANTGQEIAAWWQQNAANHFNSLLFAYSLGKTQRILSLLKNYTDQPVYCDLSSAAINACYREQAIALAETICLSSLKPEHILSGALVIAPRSLLRSPRLSFLGKRYKTAFASGWMMNKNRIYDHGFLLSDHADWPDLIRTVEESQAKRVYVQHRGKGALVRKLNTMGISAYPDSALIPANPAQLSLF